MRKKGFTRFMTLVISIVITLALFSGCSNSTPPATEQKNSGQDAPAQETKQEVIKLTASNFLPPAHLLSKMMGDMLKEVEAQSNGRLQITFVPGGSLLTAPKVADGVEQGLADIGFSHIGYNPGRFPVTEALDLPLGYSSSWIGTNVGVDFLDKYKPKEWDDFKLLQITGGTTFAIHTAKTPIKKLEDLKGKALRGAGEVADALNALGATARDIPMSEVYEGMSKGNIEGALLSAETLKSFKLADVAKYSTIAPSIGNQYIFYMIMNKSKWESLPSDLQKIFSDVGAKYQAEAALAWNKVNLAAFENASTKGIEFIRLSDDEAARWKTAVQPVIDNYITKMAGRGFSEQETKDQIAYIKERVAYWEQQQAAQNIPPETYIKK
ncbi:MAG: TRAP transporter substrate-binding protein [Thermincola sp.]|jgi:TRAP-type C4-dicarboxylate transport system substrate-binding protein|nr:TRAP transporter substrate-binding protein [Thermincola sp.]MDT3703019.1 TRAP transporter substrate-binding protein [Thermincola sp.]